MQDTEREVFDQSLEDMESFVFHSMSYMRKNYDLVREDIEKKDINKITPQDFLREYAWVVYACGFNVKILTKKWNDLSSAYYNFDPIRIPNNAEDVSNLKQSVFKIMANGRKFEAIISTGSLVRDNWEHVQTKILHGTVEDLKQLKFMGDITKYHLARNLGIDDTGKPDVHIVRLAKHFGFEDPHKFIEQASKVAKVKKGIVDLAMWYYASDHGTRKLEKVEMPI